MLGVIDTAADVTIMGGEMFKKVAAVAKFHKKDFKPADKTPYNYDKTPFRLDGKLELDVSFKTCMSRWMPQNPYCYPKGCAVSWE